MKQNSTVWKRLSAFYGKLTARGRQADGDETVESICREHNISKATFHRWRRKYGGMDLADAKRLKELEKENAELKKMLAEAMLKNRVLEEVNAKKW